MYVPLLASVAISAITGFCTELVNAVSPTFVHEYVASTTGNDLFSENI